MSNWRDEIKKLGKREFERREMERLGFWPPASSGDEAQTVEALRAKIAPLNDELREITEKTRPLRLRQTEVERELAATGDIEAQLAEIRKQRIERVKAARVERKERRAREREARLAADGERRHALLPHLGRGVSRRLHFDVASDNEKLARFQLPAWNEPADLAAFLEITREQLAWLCYHREVAPLDHYSHFSIPKRSGGTRAISAPRPYLKTAQAKILEGVLKQVEVHQAAAAFLPGLNIGDNAHKHTHTEAGGPAVVMRIDLKDFFPSINFNRVAGVFVSLGYNAGISTLLALICTESPRIEATFDGQKSFVALGERFVPQGAPTSPALTNLLCRRLDSRLSGMAKHYGFTYTRYADDLVFSSPHSDARVISLQRGVFKILEAEQFIVNPDKVAIMRRGARQSVTGLVVNNNLGPRISRRDLKRFRAILHDIETNGAESVSQKMGKSALHYARGYLAFIHMVNPETATKFRTKHTWLAASE
ncbi:RNA-directed DNA polymerase [bacterium]|nr:MAG: RNA-directed DNA polymerase [bacterium]